MIVLDATTKSLTVAMSGAPATTNPDFVTAWSDDTGTSFIEGSTDGALNGTTQVTLVAAPSASTRRLIRTVYIENKDTAAVTLTITYNNNGTLRNIAKVTLQVGDTWSTDGAYDTNGNLKQILGTVNLATQVTGTLAVANGGTGVTTSTGTGSVMLNTNPTITNYVESVVSIGNSGTAKTLDLTNGTYQTVTMTGNCTFTMPAVGAGKSFILEVSSGAGSFTGTFTSVKWPNNAAPTLTTTASRWDILTFFSDGTNWYGTYAQAFQ